MNLKQLFSKMMFWKREKPSEVFALHPAAYSKYVPEWTTSHHSQWNPNTYPDNSQWVVYAVCSVPEVTCNFDVPKQDFSTGGGGDFGGGGSSGSYD